MCVAVSIKINVLFYAPLLLLLMLKGMSIIGLISALACSTLVQTRGGLLNFIRSRIFSTKLKYVVSSSFSLNQSTSQNTSHQILSKEHIATTMFVGYFIGIVCSRSLHYQFYSWYFHSLPFLLWKTPFHTFVWLILFLGVEICWNVFPSNLYSSLMLFLYFLSKQMKD